MGSAESTGALHVDLEQQNIQSGDEIHGVVHLLVKVHTPARELVLQFKGKEKTHWTEQHREKDLLDDKSHTVTKHYGGSKTVVNLRCPIYVFTLPIEPGQYSFPFSIRTPQELPGSFDYREPSTFASHGAGAKIRYKLLAKIEGQDVHIDSAKTHVHVTKPFTGIVSSYQEEANAKISTWCCFSKGVVRVKAGFSKDAFLPGETAIVEIEVNNEGSQLEGRELVASVTRVIRMRNESGKTHTVSSTISSTRAKDAVACGGCPQAITKKILQVAIPSDASVANMASVHGQLIECEYTLSGEIVMDGCCMCCGDTPRVSKMMTIGPPPMLKAPLPQAPLDWNPQVMAASQFVAQFDTSQPVPSAPPQD